MLMICLFHAAFSVTHPQLALFERRRHEQSYLSTLRSFFLYLDAGVRSMAF